MKRVFKHPSLTNLGGNKAYFEVILFDVEDILITLKVHYYMPFAYIDCP